MVATLLEHGAMPHIETFKGYTPLISAAKSGNSPALTALLNAGADMDHINKDGLTALMAAAKSGKIDPLVVLVRPLGSYNGSVAGAELVVFSVVFVSSGRGFVRLA